MLPSLVDQSISQTIQSRAEGGNFSGLPLLWSLATGNNLLPPWWSPGRDTALRSFWKKSDHLAGAMYNMIAKMTAIPFSAVPRDYTDVKLAEEAEIETQRLMDGAEFGEGWNTLYSKTLEDMLGQDNGWFIEVIGEGDPAGPIIGQPITTAHLDASRCQRTGDPTFPVLYYDFKGKLYKLHYTRVMYNAQMSSPNEEMNGVGFCAVSRCTMTAQNLIDIAVYKMEKLGSRPHRELLITQGGLDPEDMRSAFSMANEMNDNQGFSRYSKIVVAGNASMPDADVKQVTFTTLPDGFDERTAVTLGMAVLAMGFGVDARDLFPGLEAGATRADALLAHLKQRGKGPGQIISDIEAQHNRKFLPRTMKMVFDFQDDAEDQQVAEIKHMRAQRRERDVGNAIIDNRTAREQMVADGDLTRKQFEALELKDGRLVNGTPVIALFHSSERQYKNLLTLEDVENPLDVTSNDQTFILMRVDEAMMKVNEGLLDAKNEEQRVIYQRAAAALEELKQLYIEPKPVSTTPEGAGTTPRLNPTRRQNLLAPNPKVELSTQLSTLPGKDDKELDLDDQMNLIFQLMKDIKSIPDPVDHSDYNFIVPEEEPEQPIYNVTVPELPPQQITVMLPKEVLENMVPAINVQMPEQDQPVINVDIPEQKVPKRSTETQYVQRDVTGNMTGTMSQQEYEYAK